MKLAVAAFLVAYVGCAVSSTANRTPDPPPGPPPAEVAEVAEAPVAPPAEADPGAAPPDPTPPPAAAPRRPVLAILGTYHMANNGGGDVLNIASHDVMTPQRQREIAELVALLARFRPTKIALERPATDPLVAARYRSYLAGEHELDRDEVEQIGYRLARELGHATVYPIDWRNDFDLAAVSEFAAAHGQSEVLARAMTHALAYMKRFQDRMRAATVPELYRFLNDPEQARASHRLYLSLLRVGRDERYPGPDLIAGWYERNLKLASNVLRLVESPEDRILVIVGSAHLHLLEQLARESGAFAIEPAARWLE